MTFEKFSELAKDFNLIPVYEVITADLLTPVLAYLKIREKGKQSFLLESVEGSTNMARYSFIGKNPEKIFSNIGLDLFELRNGSSTKHKISIFDFIRNEIKSKKQPKIDELPNFTGGIVGYLGYENISLVERVINFKSERFDNYDSIFGIYNTILAFDHYKHQIILITNVSVDEKTNLKDAYQNAKNILAQLREELKRPIEFSSDFKIDGTINEDFDAKEFFEQVEAGKKNIVEGDIFQIVISKRFSTNFSGDLLNVYRALRIINPSPYMYLLRI